jgi:hypothetical protein
LDTYITGDSFGFEDGISQPRMIGIDDPEPGSNGNAAVNMNTDPKLLIVTKDTWSEEGSITRPDWMYNGSFLVFRKLEQNVQAFEKLTSQWKEKNCENKEHMGAKLMGRWQSGKCSIMALFCALWGYCFMLMNCHNRCSTCHAQISHSGLDGSGFCETA